MVDSSALLNGFHVAHVIGWLMDLEIVNEIEVMKGQYFYILYDCYHQEVFEAWKFAGNNSKGFSPVTFPTIS